MVMSVIFNDAEVEADTQLQCSEDHQECFPRIIDLYFLCVLLYASIYL